MNEIEVDADSSHPKATAMWIKVRIIDAGAELFTLVDKAAETKKLLLSFEGVEFMSSAMLGGLVMLNKLAKVRGVQLRFCDLTPNVHEIFRITWLKVDEPDDDDPDDDDDSGPGNAGVFAKLPKHPGSGGIHAKPPREDS